MTCQNVRENLLDYSRCQLSDHMALSMRSHIESCAACAGELEGFRAVDRALDDFTAIEPSPYFNQRLNARLDEIKHNSAIRGWVSVWLRDRYLWTFATLFLAVTGLWLGFRHQQNEQLRSMEEVVRLQDENLRPGQTPERLADRTAQTSPEINVGQVGRSDPSRLKGEGEETISDEDLAVVENFELLQNYEFLKDLAADSTNGGGVKSN